MQGGPSSPAAAEPPPGPVSAAAGAYDEPPREDDPSSAYHNSIVGPEWGQRHREAMRDTKGLEWILGLPQHQSKGLKSIL